MDGLVNALADGRDGFPAPMAIFPRSSSAGPDEAQYMHYAAFGTDAFHRAFPDFHEKLRFLVGIGIKRYT